MAAHTPLPTLRSGRWSVAAFRDSLVATLRADRASSALRMYFYAVTTSGWEQIRSPILRWKGDRKGRQVTLVVGTDHGITDPRALKWIQDDGVEVRLMLEYQGVFHPKVVWLRGAKDNAVWIASNNLTRDGLLSNIEFAVLVKSPQVPSAFASWTEEVERGSALLTQDLLDSYASERKVFESNRAAANATTFTWKRRTEPRQRMLARATAPGDLVVEVMPRETGSEGNQLQLPIAAASAFFGLNKVGATKSVALKRAGGSVTRALTMTVFRNNTVRLSIGDLEYRDRPCVVVFRKSRTNVVDYDIVSQGIFPIRYLSLLSLCTNQTRRGSRRWGIA
jgi:hypothetical protein